jgi:hypothetical protein
LLDEFGDVHGFKIPTCLGYSMIIFYPLCHSKNIFS